MRINLPKYHFLVLVASTLGFKDNSLLNPRVQRQLPPQPTPLDMYRKMVHVSFWDDVAVETNRYATDFYQSILIQNQKVLGFPLHLMKLSIFFFMYSHGTGEKANTSVILVHKKINPYSFLF
jgi:hypothetical protein